MTRAVPVRRFLLIAVLILVWAGPALAKYYFYTDSSGHTHMVDGIEKVPREYRGQARPWESPDAVQERQVPRSATPKPDRPEWMDGQPEVEALPEEPDLPPRREALPPAPSERAGAPPQAEALLDRISSAVHGSAAFLFPLSGRQAFMLWIVGLVLALVVRGGASLRAHRAAGVVGGFADRYEKLVAKGSAATWAWREARALEQALPLTMDLVRAAEVGPTTVAAVRRMGGQAVDGGRVDALRACLSDAEVVDATRFLLRSAEGVYRHRSITPWVPSGWLETVFMLPRFIVWRGPGAGDASGIRVLILLYWLWLAAYAFGGG